jgi:hypothetical protein
VPNKLFRGFWGFFRGFEGKWRNFGGMGKKLPGKKGLFLLVNGKNKIKIF